MCMEIQIAVQIIVNNDGKVRNFTAALDLEQIDRDHMPERFNGRILGCDLLDEHALHAEGNKYLWIVGPGARTRYLVVFDAQSFVFSATRG